MPLTLEERIARIEVDPALTALSKICDLGTCAGKGGFQKAIDIASTAVDAAFNTPGKPSFVDKMTDAEIAVHYERQRQIHSESFSAERDDSYTKQQLARAAAAYAIAEVHPAGRLWPWTSAWWKPSDHRRNCVKAAALLLAEIERIDRAQAAGGLNDLTQGVKSE